MSKIITGIAISLFLVSTTLQAQDLVVDRQPDFGVGDDIGVLAGESNRFDNFSGFYPADFFELRQATTLQEFVAFGSSFIPDSFPTSPGSLDGLTVQIFSDANGEPDGNAFADVFKGGNFGSEGIVYLPAIELGNGFEFLENDNGVSTVQVDFSVASSEPVALPAGGYWITLALRTPAWHPGDPSGRWRWQPSVSQSGATRVIMSRTTSGDVQVWEPVSALGNSFAWQLTGEAALLIGDINQDGEVNLLDVAGFVDLLSTGGFQAEADINQDGEVNLLDVSPFVELLSM